MKIYISGKITEEPNYIKIFNKAETELQEQGHVTLNPVIYPNGLTWDEYMHLSYAMLDCADAIYMLHNWTSSRGANLEYEYAKKQGKFIMFQEGD